MVSFMRCVFIQLICISVQLGLADYSITIDSNTVHIRTEQVLQFSNAFLERHPVQNVS